MPAQLQSMLCGWGGVFYPTPCHVAAPPEIGRRRFCVVVCLAPEGRANPPSVASGGDDRRESASFRLRKHGLLLAEQIAKSAWNTVVTTGFLSPTTEWGRCVEMLIFRQCFRYLLWQIR